jgi:chorismate mutase
MTSAVNSPETQADSIDMLRRQIDALDAALIQIVAERARVSRRIQTARMNAGGTRVELGRERTVRNTYRDGLGPDAVTLAEAVLQVCRGAR